MWIKKSESRILEDQEKTKNENDRKRVGAALKVGVLVFLIVFFLKILLSVTIGIDYSPHIPVTSEIIKIQEIPAHFFDFFDEAIYVSIIFFLFRYFLPSMFRSKSSSLMCDKCYSIKNYDKIVKCKCGGKFYSLDNFEWIAEKNENSIIDSIWVTTDDE